MLINKQYIDTYCSTAAKFEFLLINKINKLYNESDYIIRVFDGYIKNNNGIQVNPISVLEINIKRDGRLDIDSIIEYLSKKINNDKYTIECKRYPVYEDRNIDMIQHNDYYNQYLLYLYTNNEIIEFGDDL